MAQVPNQLFIAMGTRFWPVGGNTSSKVWKNKYFTFWKQGFLLMVLEVKFII